MKPSDDPEFKAACGEEISRAVRDNYERTALDKQRSHLILPKGAMRVERVDLDWDRSRKIGHYVDTNSGEVFEIREPIDQGEVAQSAEKASEGGVLKTPWQRSNGWPTMEAAARRDKAFKRAEATFRIVEAFLPKRLRNEDLGDTIEDLNRLRADPHCRAWQVYCKVLSTCFWLLLKAFREVKAALGGKKADAE